MDYLFILFFKLLFLHCRASCNYPEDLQNRVWTDTLKGSLSYGQTTMSGWAFTLFTKTIVEWECYYRRDHLVISRSTELYTMFGTGYRVYICQNFKNVTKSTYWYYLMSDKSDTGERVFITNLVPEDVCSVCSPTSGPDDTEYHTITTQGEDFAVVPSVGCNPCTRDCGLPGTPILPTAMPNDNHKPVFEQTPPNKTNKSDGNTAEGKLIGGVVGGLLAVCLLVALFVWMTRRGFCVKNVLESFYEEKHFHAT